MYIIIILNNDVNSYCPACRPRNGLLVHKRRICYCAYVCMSVCILYFRLFIYPSIKSISKFVFVYVPKCESCRFLLVCLSLCVSVFKPSKPPGQVCAARLCPVSLEEGECSIGSLCTLHAACLIWQLAVAYGSLLEFGLCTANLFVLVEIQHPT